MKHSEITAPLFEIINKIVCETSIQISVRIDSRPHYKKMNWYSGNVDAPDYGDLHDWLYLDEDGIDEDKAVDWIQQLEELYREYTGEYDREGIDPDDVFDVDHENRMQDIVDGVG